MRAKEAQRPNYYLLFICVLFVSSVEQWTVQFKLFKHIHPSLVIIVRILRRDGLSPENMKSFSPKSSESQVSDVSVPVTFVANVDADSVDVLIVVSAVDADDAPITITFMERKFNYNIFLIFFFTPYQMR